MTPDLDRIVVIGSSCAGKSTFARRLAAALTHEYVELDELFWGPDWQPKRDEEFRSLTAEVAARPCWIVEGNYSRVRDILWPRATAVVWLNFGFPTVVWRAVRRTVRRVFSREPLWHGNRESVRRSFLSRESILVWVVTTFHRRQREFRTLRSGGEYDHLHWIEFNHSAETDRYLRAVNNAV